MKLIVAEKFSVAQAICSALGVHNAKEGYIQGNSYTVTWCMGHLTELSMPEEYGEEYKKWDFSTLPIIPQRWKLHVSQDTAKKKQYDIAKRLMNDSGTESIICATDADREGECIFRYIYLLSGCKKPFQRLWISSLEKSAVKDGFSKLKSSHDYDNLFEAGFCRAKADWLTGYNFTRLFSVRYNTDKPLNIGRVQTPTLAMIVEREDKIKNFEKERSFSVDLTLDSSSGLIAVSDEQFDDENTASEIARQCKGKTATVNNIQRELKNVKPPKLYDLTTLQRDCNKYFGYTAQETLDYVQSLYEKKLCTYPRTDSRYIPDDMGANALSILSLIPDTFNFPKSTAQKNILIICNTEKAADHPALIPQGGISNTDISTLPSGERTVLSLMAARLMCAVEEAHTYETAKADITVEDVSFPHFSISGKTIIKNGWKELDTKLKAILKAGTDNDDEKDEKENTVFPQLAKQYFNIDAAHSEHWTSPPKSYTEDTLLSAMEHAGHEHYDENTEKKGIGTPATHAKIIEGLVKRGYVQREKKKLIPTEKGINLISVVPEEIKSAKLTADWEMELQDIEKGKGSGEKFMSEIDEFVRSICKKYSESSEQTLFSSNLPLGKCPHCGNDVVRGRYGFYCSGKCGMNIGKVFGKELTENQLTHLLNGKAVSYTAKGIKTTVLPEAVPFDYIKDGIKRNGFQWNAAIRKN